MKKLFIFDFDGTIADTKSIVKKGLVDFSREKSLPLPDVEAICYGYSNPDNYDFGWGVDKKEQKILMDKAFIDISNKICEGVYIPELFNNTEALLAELDKRGNVITLCTSREKSACQNILQHYGLLKYFSVLKTRDDVINRAKKPKPNPELLFEIIDEVGANNDNTYIVGDTDADIKAAKNANIKSIGVSWGYFTKEQIKETEPNYIVDDFMEILKI